MTSRGQWRPAVQGYLAAISYCDWIIGRLIEALDRSGLADDTVIILWGDNGFHLGEKLHWRKFVLWEEATRVPMIVVPPRKVPARPRYDKPVGLLDLFPTIADLCGVKGPGHDEGTLPGSSRFDIHEAAMNLLCAKGAFFSAIMLSRRAKSHASGSVKRDLSPTKRS